MRPWASKFSARLQNKQSQLIPLCVDHTTLP